MATRSLLVARVPRPEGAAGVPGRAESRIGSHSLAEVDGFLRSGALGSWDRGGGRAGPGTSGGCDGVGAGEGAGLTRAMEPRGGRDRWPDTQ